MNIDIEHTYTKYGPMVYRRCLKLLQSESIAMDAMQEVFMQLLNKQDQLSDQGLSSLLYTMATNFCLNQLRSQKVRDDYQKNQMQFPADEEDIHSNSEKTLMDIQTLKQIFAKFDQRTCELAIYHYVDGFTFDEISKMTSMSKSNIRRLLSELKQSVKLDTLTHSPSIQSGEE